MPSRIAQQSGKSASDSAVAEPLHEKLFTRGVVFYLWLPVGLGLFMGATQAGRTSTWPLAFGISYFVTVCCIDWWLVDAGCRLSKIGLKALNPPLWLVLLSGSILGAYLGVKPANWAIIQLWQLFLPSGVETPAPPDLALVGHIEELIAGITPWLLANYVFYHFGRMPRYGFEPPRARTSFGNAALPAQPDDFAGRIMKKVKPDRRGELLALNAQGHYLRVITTSGEDLVLYRFGDAITEMPDDAGIQVHRSWWISATAIKSRDSATAKQIVLCNGTAVPVSRTFRPELKRRIQA